MGRAYRTLVGAGAVLVAGCSDLTSPKVRIGIVASTGQPVVVSGSRVDVQLTVVNLGSEPFAFEGNTCGARLLDAVNAAGNTVWHNGRSGAICLAYSASITVNPGNSHAIGTAWNGGQFRTGGEGVDPASPGEYALTPSPHYFSHLGFVSVRPVFVRVVAP